MSMNNTWAISSFVAGRGSVWSVADIDYLSLRFVHHAHPAASELFENAVVRNGLANHVWEDCIWNGC
jgi:hypothetical protein